MAIGKKMREEVKCALYIVTLGISLTVYARQNFASKEEVKDIKATMKTIDQRVYGIRVKLIPNKGK